MQLRDRQVVTRFERPMHLALSPSPLQKGPKLSRWREGSGGPGRAARGIWGAELVGVNNSLDVDVVHGRVCLGPEGTAGAQESRFPT